jgi:pilus assembly protein CpaF
MSSEKSPVTLPGRPALERVAEDSGSGLRIKEGLRRLALRLEDETLYAPRPVEKDAVASAKVIEDIKSRIQPQLLRVMDQGESRLASKPILEKPAAQQTVEACLAQDATLAATREERGALLTKVLDEVLGLGPIEPLLKDPEVSEVMVNGRSCVYVEIKGRLHPTDVQFSSDTQLRAVIDRIVSPIGRRVDESMPLCDARLADGSRVNIILPPLALDGPTITIRKFMAKAMSVEDLVRIGSLSAPMADFLRACVVGRKNIVVSGGTGSGKTTLLNALSSLIPDDERIVTIEDAAELRLQKPHVVRLESRPANAEGEGAIPIRRLVINALRMRPDRIVVGECRGGEALDMLQAMNTGHDGSLTTVHANTPRDA